MPPAVQSDILEKRSLTAKLRWTPSSGALLGAFLAIIALILYVWWPLVMDYIATYNPTHPWWSQVDWLLIGIFLFMTLMILSGVDLRRDAWIALVAMVGGLVIESWGTQTNLWYYYTSERPPLWIIPAWPIATLVIDRMVRVLDHILPANSEKIYSAIYWVVMVGFYIYLWIFTAPTLDKSLSWLALLTCTLLIFFPSDKRRMLLIFIAGSVLGYFLELWGTTRLCWTYYTLQTPPFFAVLAHGLAAVAFWRSGSLVLQAVNGFNQFVKQLLGGHSI